ncbi:MAG TPA: hypothetical protein PLH70_05760 [Bacteroidales bacterium]|nr:hypothetical protein [Bacteroidales bacterium]HOH23037.1 hypothetical protein [Bacteroidales bacterium]HPZ03725.1 hypothetical protein [Bacteroidales bacterium]HQB75288.1 hypothetical protein [Bacteroidales bacterium]
MKKITLFTLLGFGFLMASAQLDTTIYRHGNRITIQENEDGYTLFIDKEGVDCSEDLSELTEIIDKYIEDLFENDSILSDKKKQIEGDNKTNQPFFRHYRNLQRKHYRAHLAAFSFGLSNWMSTEGDIGNTRDGLLKYNSFEFGWIPFTHTFRLSGREKSSAFLLAGAMGFRFHWFNADKNRYFYVINDRVRQIEEWSDIHYDKSYVATGYLTIPIVFEWQKPFKKTSFYIQAGVETGIKMYGYSFYKYRLNDPKRDVTYKIPLSAINPIACDARVSMGIGAVSIYFRYGLIPLFRDGRGDRVNPVALGVNLHF